MSNPYRPRRLRSATLALAGVLVLGGAVPARAAFDTAACLAKKAQTWGKLRQCQRGEQAKVILGKAADLAKCQARFDATTARLDLLATGAGAACRYRDNGDNTVTDFKTGLMWVKLSGLDGIPQPYILDADNRWNWKTALEVASALNGPAVNASAITPVPGNGLYADWRLPNIVELASIVDLGGLGCGFVGGTCIDPILGPTDATYFYWSSSSAEGFPDEAWLIAFWLPASIRIGKVSEYHVRAVRSAL